MSSYAVTVDAFSPIIQYNPPDSWVDGEITDAERPRYELGTFKATTAKGATATIVFDGVSIVVIGARRANHGQFSISLDGVEGKFDGFDAAGKFQQPLFQKMGLQPGRHTLILKNDWENADAPWLDVDYIAWDNNVSDGHDGLYLTPTIIDDSNSAWRYSLEWSNNNNIQDQYLNKTVRFTSEQGATATLKFSGQRIGLFGGLLPDHGKYSVSINGSAPVVYTGKSPGVHTGQLLFFKDNLGLGTHELVLTNIGPGWLDIDYAEVASLASTGTRPSNPISPSATGTSRDKSSNQLKTSLIAGTTAGAAVLLIGIGFLVFWRLRRRRRLNRSKSRDQVTFDAGEPEPFIIAPSNTSGDPQPVEVVYETATPDFISSQHASLAASRQHHPPSHHEAGGMKQVLRRGLVTNPITTSDSLLSSSIQPNPIQPSGPQSYGTSPQDRPPRYAQ